MKSKHKWFLIGFALTLALLIPISSVLASGTFDFGTLFRTEHNSKSYSAYKIEVERAKSYTITYDPNGGVGDVNRISAKESTSYTVVDQGYTKSYYDFIGYNTAADGSGTPYLVGESFVVTGNITLYAQYEHTLIDIEVTVIWNDRNNADGSRPTNINVEIRTNGAIVMLKNVDVLTDANEQTITFTGLRKYDDSGNAHVYTAAGQPRSPYITSVSGFTIAYTLARTYTINYDPNGGLGVGYWKIEYGGTYFTVEDMGYMKPCYTSSYPPPTSPSEYANLIGYNTAADGSGTPYFAGESFVVIGDITLYAQYEHILIDIEVTVIWADFNNLLGLRPANVTVAIFRNGAPYEVKNVPVPTSANEQTIIFDNMEKYDDWGNSYYYAAAQQRIPHYATTVSGLTVTNEVVY